MMSGVGPEPHVVAPPARRTRVRWDLGAALPPLDVTYEGWWRDGVVRLGDAELARGDGERAFRNGLDATLPDGRRVRVRLVSSFFGGFAWRLDVGGRRHVGAARVLAPGATVEVDLSVSLPSLGARAVWLGLTGISLCFQAAFLLLEAILPAKVQQERDEVLFAGIVVLPGLGFAFGVAAVWMLRASYRAYQGSWAAARAGATVAAVVGALRLVDVAIAFALGAERSILMFSGVAWCVWLAWFCRRWGPGEG